MNALHHADPVSLSSSGLSRPTAWRWLTLRRAYIGALLLLGILSLLSNVLLEVGLSATRTDAQRVNVAGRQRMLSQRIAWNASRLQLGNGSQREARRADLRRSLREFENGYRRLTDPSSGLYGSSEAQSLADSYRLNLEPLVRRYLAAVTELLVTEVSAPQALDTVFTLAQGPLLEGLDRAVQGFEQRNRTLVRRLEGLSWLRTALVLVLLTTLGLGVFRPLERRNRATLRSLELSAQALSRAAAYAEALLEITRRVESGDTPEQVACFSVEAVARVADVDWGALVVVRGDEAQVLTGWASARVSPAFLARVGQGSRRGEGVLWQVLETGQSVYVDDYSRRPGALPALVQAGMHAGAWVPLATFAGGAYLLIAARLHHTPGWSEPDRALFEAAARTVSVTLERQTHRQALEQAALTDPLTGLGNRRAFEHDLEGLCASARRHGYPLCVLSLDLDGLKHFNDHEGHARGDALLIGFARALEGAFRADDRLYRLGGDEFTALLSYCGPESESVVMGRVRTAVQVLRAAGFERVDASAGAAFFPALATSPLELTQQADARMYTQKRGRKAAE